MRYGIKVSAWKYIDGCCLVDHPETSRTAEHMYFARGETSPMWNMAILFMRTSVWSFPPKSS